MAPPQNVVFGLVQGPLTVGCLNKFSNQTSNVTLIRRQAYILITTSPFSQLFRGPEDTSKVTYLVLAI